MTQAVPADDLGRPEAARRAGESALFFTVVIIIFVLFAYLFWSGYETSRRDALVTAGNLSRVLANEFEDILDRTQSDLRVFAAILGPEDFAGGTPKVRQDDLRTRIGAHLLQFPEVTHLRVLDAHGRSVLLAGKAVEAEVNVAGRPWFRRLVEDDSLGLVLSDVLLDKGPDLQIIVMAVPVRDKSGHLLGAIAAALDLSAFQAVIDRLDIGEGGLVAWHRTDDLHLLMRRPQARERLNEAPRSADLVRAIPAAQPESQGDYVSSVDGTARSYAIRRFRGYPFAVVVALATKDYLAPWRRQTALSILAALDLLILLVLLYGRQITGRRHLAAYAVALQDSESRFAGEAVRYRALLRTASDGVHVLDLDGNLVEASDSFLRSLGYPEGGTPGLSLADWDPQVPSGGAREFLATFLAGGQRVFQCLHRRRDGTLIDVEVHARLVELEGRTYIYAASRDITERKRIEEALVAAKTEAERANAAKSRFLAAASHDLRQPLQGLNLYVGVLTTTLEGAGQGPGQGQRVIRQVESCLSSLNEMLDDLLDLSKLDAQAITPKPSRFDVAEVVRKVLAANHPAATAKGLRLRWVDTGLATCTDAMLFERIVANLVSNAVRYTDQGGVLVGCRRRMGRRWLEVWDSGIGIPADKTEEIFQEFAQIGNPGRDRDKGSGLGLAIVAKAASALAVEIRVSSRLGSGSAFAVEIPPDREPAQPGEPTEE